MKLLFIYTQRNQDKEFFEVEDVTSVPRVGERVEIGGRDFVVSNREFQYKTEYYATGYMGKKTVEDQIVLKLQEYR